MGAPKSINWRAILSALDCSCCEYRSGLTLLKGMIGNRATTAGNEVGHYSEFVQLMRNDIVKVFR